MLDTIENIATQADLVAVTQAPTRSRLNAHAEGQIRIMDGWRTVFACEYFLHATYVAFTDENGGELTARYDDEGALAAAVYRFQVEIDEYRRALAAAADESERN